MYLISKYSPFIGLAFAFILYIYFQYFYLSSIGGNDAAGNGLAKGYSLILFYIIFTPFVLLLLISTIRYIQDPTVFSGKWIWTFVHLSPLLIPTWLTFVFTVDWIDKENQIKKNESFLKVRRDYTHATEKDRFLINEDNIIIYIKINTSRGPSIDPLGKIVGTVFENHWSEDILIDENSFDINNFRDSTGKTLKDKYIFQESKQDFSSWYSETTKVIKELE